MLPSFYPNVIAYSIAKSSAAVTLIEPVAPATETQLNPSHISKYLCSVLYRTIPVSLFAEAGRCTFVPTGTINPPVPSILKYPAPLCSNNVTASTALLVIVESLNARSSITTAPVPFDDSTKSVFIVVASIVFPLITISSTSILGVSNLSASIVVTTLSCI